MAGDPQERESQAATEHSQSQSQSQSQTRRGLSGVWAAEYPVHDREQRPKARNHNPFVVDGREQYSFQSGRTALQTDLLPRP